MAKIGALFLTKTAKNHTLWDRTYKLKTVGPRIMYTFTRDLVNKNFLEGEKKRLKLS